MNYSILKTKLFIPPLQSKLVPRPRFSHQINSAIQNRIKLILIAAPAGYGKTTAVSCWARQNHQQVAWLSLDEGDNEEAVFWIYTIAALQTIQQNFGRKIFENLISSLQSPIDSILPELVNELAELPQPVTLVLDDYHVISNKEIHAYLKFLLKHQPPQFHLVIVTRADPPLSIARLRAHRMLVELRADDLRFTFNESQMLLNEIMGLGLSREDINLVERRTEGWSVGLVLAAKSMQGMSEKHNFITAFSGSHHYILEYLVEEVINQQPKFLREFLLETSILDQLCGSLCNAVTGLEDSNEILRQLFKENLFIIPLDSDLVWYRYHSLFCELLANQLYKEQPEIKIQTLQMRASEWYYHEGNLDKAVQYALKGQNYTRAANLIELAAGITIARGQAKRLIQWIHALPEKVIKNHPVLLMRKGWAIFLTGNVSEASRVLLEAQQALDDVPSGEAKNTLEGQLLAMLATLTSLTKDLPAAITQAEEALKKLPHKEVIYRARATRVLGVCYTLLGEIGKALENLETAKILALSGQNKFLASEILSQIATAQKHQGQLRKAFDTYRQILDLYEVPEENPPICLGYIGMAEIALEWNDLENAHKYLTIGIDQCYKGSIGYALQPALLIQGILKYALGDEAGAKEAIAKGKSISRNGGGSIEGILELAIFQSRLNLQLGKLANAKQWAAGDLLPAGWSFDNLPTILFEKYQSLLAFVYARLGEPEKTYKIYDAVYDQVRSGGRIARMIELKLSKALALQSRGRNREAFEAFKSCLSLAEPEGYVRLFLEAGEAVHHLLHQAIVQGCHVEYASKLLLNLENHQVYARSRISEAASGILCEELTERELEVLRLICEGCSNQQIAEDLVVSVNTIKKHTSNIYGKLGVRNRAQAAIRAQELKLIQRENYPSESNFFKLLNNTF